MRLVYNTEGRKFYFKIKMGRPAAPLGRDHRARRHLTVALFSFLRKIVKIKTFSAMNDIAAEE